MSTVFITALKNHDITSLRNCQKSDLHNHSFLGGNAEYIEKIYNIKIARLTHKLRSMDEMHKWVKRFIQPIFSEDAEGRKKKLFHLQFPVESHHEMVRSLGVMPLFADKYNNQQLLDYLVKYIP